MAKHLFEQSPHGHVNYLGEVVSETSGSYVVKSGTGTSFTHRVMKYAMGKNIVVELSDEGLKGLLERLEARDRSYRVFVQEAKDALARIAKERSDGLFSIINEEATKGE